MHSLLRVVDFPESRTRDEWSSACEDEYCEEMVSTQTALALAEDQDFDAGPLAAARCTLCLEFLVDFIANTPSLCFCA